MRPSGIFRDLRSKCAVYIGDAFYLDLRSLALFRVGLGLIILYNLCYLCSQIDAFFGPHGIIPLAIFKSSLQWSLHAISDNYYFILFLLILNAAFALMLIFGFRTRLATIACWIMAVSLCQHTPLINYGADVALKVFLMWGVFLPLGARFSFDSRMTGPKNSPADRFVSTATFAFICQMFIIYTFAAFLKNQPSWTKNYTMLQQLFSLHDFATPLATWLLRFPDLLMALTFLTILLEQYGTFLLLIATPSSLFRSIAVIMFMAFHFCIYLTLHVGWFPAIMIVGWLALIPSVWWQKSGFLKTDLPSPTIKRNAFLDCAVALLLIYTLVLNIRSVEIAAKKRKDGHIENFGKKTGLWQKWSFFNPGPNYKSRKYYFIPIFAPTSNVKQPGAMSPIEIKGDHRWIRMFSNLPTKRFKKHYPYLSSYLAYRWNKEHPEGPRAVTTYVFYVIPK